ncbi:MAG: fasciclin domain-containing protein [Planctomycetota bacterium]
MNFLKNRRRRRPRISSQGRRLSAQMLERRQLLAGDVEVFFRGDDLYVFGDQDDNSVEIRIDSLGNLVAEGLNETTIDGSTDPVIIAFPTDVDVIDDVRVFLGRGDDSILIDGLTIDDDLYVSAGRGDDAIGLLRTEIGDDASIYGGSGALEFSLDLSSVDDDLRVYGSREDDVIVFDESFVGDDTRVFTSSGNDTLIVRASEHQDDVTISTGSGEDFVAVVDGTQIGDDAFISLGRGDDSLFVRDSGVGDRVSAFGGRGDDAIGLENPDLNLRRTRVSSFESEEVLGADELIDAAVEQLVDSGARRPTIVDIAVNNGFTSLVDAVIATDLLGAISGSNPQLTVFAPTNDAFATVDIPAGLDLATILQYHIVVGNVDSGGVLASETLTSFNNLTITIEDEAPIVNGQANLEIIDVRARNGIVHVIDAVLIPPPAPEADVA